MFRYSHRGYYSPEPPFRQVERLGITSKNARLTNEAMLSESGQREGERGETSPHGVVSERLGGAPSSLPLNRQTHRGTAAAHGASLVEYLLLLIILVVGFIAAIQVIGNQISSSFSSVSSGLQA